MMRRDKEKCINEQCKRIEDNSITNSIKDLYQGVKNSTNKFKPTIDTIKDENGKILGEAEEVKERWAHYSTDLYKKNPNIVVPQHTSGGSCYWAFRAVPHQDYLQPKISL